MNDPNWRGKSLSARIQECENKVVDKTDWEELGGYLKKRMLWIPRAVPQKKFFMIYVTLGNRIMRAYMDSSV